MRLVRIAVCCLVLPAGWVQAQNLLTNSGFQNAALTPWVQIGTHGGRVTQATGFGIIPSQNTAAWATVYNNGSGGVGVWEGVYQTVANIGPGTYILQADVLAHNRTDAFLWVPGQASSAPTDTFVRFGYDLTGGTDPDAGTVVLTPPLNTGAQWRRQQIQFTKATVASTITVFMLTQSHFSHTGNWAAFDNTRLDNVTNCSTAITVTDMMPSSLNTPPNPGVQSFTINGTNLNQASGANLVGPSLSSPPVITGTITASSASQLTVDFDLTNAIPGVYDLLVPHLDGGCRPGTMSGAFTLNCACPATTVTGVARSHGLSGSNHVLTLSGLNVTCLTGVKLRKTRDGGAEINATSLTPNGSDLDVQFNLTGAEGGRYDLLFTHPCQQITPAQGMTAAFLVYMPEITNGSFEEGWTNDPTTGSVCANPAANGNRPKARHWDQRLFAASGQGGHKRDGNVWFPECINGRIKNLTGDHYNGLDVVTDGTNPTNVVSFFQTIAAPHVNENGVSTQPFNVRAEMAINGASAAFPAVGRIRLYDGTDADGNTIATTVISSRFEAADDFGLITDPTYEVIAPAGTMYTSDPPVLTIEFRVTTSENSPSNTAVGFWVDNVRTGPYVAPGCSPTVWADADDDHDVDLDDFGVWQQCVTGSTPGLPAGLDYCKCLDREVPFNVIDVADFVEFTRCASGANVPWTPAVAPLCEP